MRDDPTPPSEESSTPYGQSDLSIIPDLVAAGGVLYEEGLREYGPWAERMVAEIGEGVRDYLENVFPLIETIYRKATALTTPEPGSTTIVIDQPSSLPQDCTNDGVQAAQFGELSPADSWDRDVARRALDELFSLARQYRSSEAYLELLAFVGRFRFYAPFNAMLVHIQKPGATFVAPPHRWLREYGRRVQAGARPLVILQPMGPVMFVFDVSETEPAGEAPALPPEVVKPFEVRGGYLRGELLTTIENAKRDGVTVVEREAGSQSAGAISAAQAGRYLKVVVKDKPERQYITVPLRYELLLNRQHSPEGKYATLAHELGHLYCGHLGTPNGKWWPDRRGLPHDVREFEAESVCYLVCTRLGVDNPSEEYLASYLHKHNETPSISLDCVMKAAGLIEQMGCGRLKPRKEKEE